MKKQETYQWLKTDLAGTVVKVSGEEDGYITFDNGSRCASSLLNEYLLKIETKEDALDLESYPKKIAESKSTPEPEPEPITENQIGDNLYTGAPDNPIRELLKRQSSDNKMRVDFSYYVNIPKPSVFEILKESFGDTVEEEISQMATETININELKDQLDELMKKKVKSYYSKSKSKK